jgi:hypothetical protein
MRLAKTSTQNNKKMLNKFDHQINQKLKNFLKKSMKNAKKPSQ